MRIALVSPMYPSPSNPVFGAFIKRQEDALRLLGVQFCHAVDSDYQPGEKTIQKYGVLARRVAQLRSEQFDLVHVHFPNVTGVFAAMLARYAHTPLIATFHGGELDPATLQDMTYAKRVITRRSAVWTARQAFASIGVGPEVVQALLHAGIAQEKVFMWDMGVDCQKCQRIDKEAARHKLGLPAQAQVVVFAGWLTPAKSPESVVHAAHILRDRHPQCHWFLLGSGPLESTLMDLVRSYGLADRVSLPGRRSWDEVQEWNAAADVHVMPTLTEAFGLSCLEAMACGTPVVASAVGGLLSFVVDNQNGCLIPPGDAEALAARVSQLLTNPQQARALGEQGRKTAQSHDLHVQARKVYDLYTTALSDGGRSPR